MSYQQKQFHWAAQKERGNRFLIAITALVIKYLPLLMVKFVTFWIVLYFFLTSRSARQNIRRYHQHLQASFPTLQLPKMAVFRHFLAFGEALTDRFAVWGGKITHRDLTMIDPTNINHKIMNMSKDQRGELLVCCHLGNMELARAFSQGEGYENANLNVLIHSPQSAQFNEVLQKAGASELSLIQVSELSVAKMLELQERVDRGEWLAIAADRIPLQGDKTLKIPFLGKEAEFPQGAWLLANILKVPVNLIFCVKEQGKYQIKLMPFSEGILGRGANRDQEIRLAMERYANILAKECAKNPLLWFNFYDFWQENTKK